MDDVDETLEVIQLPSQASSDRLQRGSKDTMQYCKGATYLITVIKCELTVPVTVAFIVLTLEDFEKVCIAIPRIQSSYIRTYIVRIYII